jgi:hypothetical protein
VHFLTLPRTSRRKGAGITTAVVLKTTITCFGGKPTSKRPCQTHLHLIGEAAGSALGTIRQFRWAT